MKQAVLVVLLASGFCASGARAQTPVLTLSAAQRSAVDAVFKRYNDRIGAAFDKLPAVKAAMLKDLQGIAGARDPAARKSLAAAYEAKWASQYSQILSQNGIQLSGALAEIKAVAPLFEVSQSGPMGSVTIGPPPLPRIARQPIATGGTFLRTRVLAPSDAVFVKSETCTGVMQNGAVVTTDPSTIGVTTRSLEGGTCIGSGTRTYDFVVAPGEAATLAFGYLTRTEGGTIATGGVGHAQGSAEVTLTATDATTGATSTPPGFDPTFVSFDVCAFLLGLKDAEKQLSGQQSVFLKSGSYRLTVRVWSSADSANLIGSSFSQQRATAQNITITYRSAS